MADYTIEKLQDADGNNFAFRDPTKATQADIHSSVNTHNSDSNAHSDIRESISNLDQQTSINLTQLGQTILNVDTALNEERTARVDADNTINAALLNKANTDGSNATGTWPISVTGRASSIMRFDGYYSSSIYGLKLGKTSNKSSTGYCNVTLLIKISKRGSGSTGVFVAQIEARGTSANNFSINPIGGSDSFDTPVYLARSSVTSSAPYEATWYLMFNGTQSYMSFEIAILGAESNFTEDFAALTTEPSISSNTRGKMPIINQPAKYINTTFTGTNQYNIVNGNFTIPIASMVEGVMYNFLVRGFKSSAPVITWNNNTSSTITFYATTVTATGTLAAGSSKAAVIGTYNFKVKNHEICRCVKSGNTIYVDMGY